jgi:hypothetical protein
MRHISIAALSLGLLFGTGASAQPTEPRRAPLRADLAHAAEHLAQHPHPYAMSEEVARVRLQKMGFEEITTLSPAEGNKFQVQAIKNGQPQKLMIDRLTGAVRTTQ